MALIDPGIVLQLIATRLSAQAGSKVTLLLPGDPDPEQTAGSAKPWMRLLSVDLTPEKTERSNDEDTDTARAATGSLGVTMLVVVPEEVSRASFGSVGEAVGICCAALAGVTLTDGASAVQVDIDMSPRWALQADADDSRGLLVGTVAFAGTVVRTSGRTVKAFM